MLVRWDPEVFYLGRFRDLTEFAAASRFSRMTFLIVAVAQSVATVSKSRDISAILAFETFMEISFSIEMIVLSDKLIVKNTPPIL